MDSSKGQLPTKRIRWSGLPPDHVFGWNTDGFTELEVRVKEQRRYRWYQRKPKPQILDAGITGVHSEGEVLIASVRVKLPFGGDNG